MDQAVERRDFLSLAVAAVALTGITSLVLGEEAELAAFKPADLSGNLRDKADRKGLLCGTAVTAKALGADEKLRDALRRDCNILVPENELKWGVVQARPGGPLDFSGAEKIYAFARENNMAMRGHALSWWNSQPAWAADHIGAMSPGKAGDYLQDYIHQVATYWRGRLVQWDVVNEPIGAKDVLLDRLFGPKLGEQYIDLAFEAAADADPDTLRVLNHDLIAQDHWYQEAQLDSTVRLMDRLMSRGARIQCFGFEGHLRTAYGFSETRWRAFCDHLTGMGLKLMITELDVDDGGSIGSAARRDEAAAGLASRLVGVMLSYPECLGVLTWGNVDSYSWLRQSPDRARSDGQPLRPTLRDDDYRPKDMWAALASAIETADPRPV